MLKKALLSISLLTSLAALSATAHAGETISDRRYWPSEVRESADTTKAANQDPRAALASMAMPRRTENPSNAYEATVTTRYHGGPKNP